MLELVQNSINSEYIIINIKLEFNDLEPINYKKIYYNIICEWIKCILDKYNKIYNWTFYINNLNYKIIRVFLLIDKYNYPNMDDNNLIYTTNAFEFYNKNDINILELCKNFNIEDLNIIILKEFEIIKNNLDSTKSICSSIESNNSSEINIPINYVMENHFNYNNKEINNLDEVNNLDEINEFEEVNEFEEINIKSNNLTNSNENLIKKKIIPVPKIENIHSIGVSGVNKNTFIYELKKINVLKHSDIYYNKYHNIFNNQLFKKIKENNKYYWILYDNYIDEINFIDSNYNYNCNSSTHSKDYNIFYDSNLNFKLNTILSIIDNKHNNHKYKNNKSINNSFNLF